MAVAKAYSIAALSEELGRDRVGLGKVLAGIEPDETKGERSLWLMRTVVDALVDGNAHKNRGDKEISEIRLKDTKAQILEIQLKEKLGQMVEIEEVQSVLSSVLGSVRSRILALPTRLAQRLAQTQDPVKTKILMQKSVDSALEEIANMDLTAMTFAKEIK